MDLRRFLTSAWVVVCFAITIGLVVASDGWPDHL